MWLKEAERKEGESNRYDSSKADDRQQRGELVGVMDITVGGAGCGPGGDNEVREMDVTVIAGDDRR